MPGPVNLNHTQAQVLTSKRALGTSEEAHTFMHFSANVATEVAAAAASRRYQIAGMLPKSDILSGRLKFSSKQGTTARETKENRPSDDPN